MGIPSAPELLGLVDVARALASAGVCHVRVGDFELSLSELPPQARSAATAEAPSPSPPSADDRIATPEDMEALLFASSDAGPPPRNPHGGAE